MRIKKDYVVKQVAGQTIVIPIGNESVNFNGMITLNQTGKFLIEYLKEDISIEQLVNELMNEYDVSYEVAYKDCCLFIDKLREIDILV